MVKWANRFTLLITLVLIAVLFAGCGGGVEGKKNASPSGKVMLYSSMKDSQLAALKSGFMKKHPDIQMDYYTAATGSVMTKLAAEEKAGGMSADVIWVGEPTNYMDFKAKGLLMQYKSPEAVNIPERFKDKDDMFITARVVMLGFVYNKNQVKSTDVPKNWEDLLKPQFKGRIAITDPTFSGTTLYTVAGLVQNKEYGWALMEKLKANDMKLERSSIAVVEKASSGEYQVSVGVDYIAATLISQGSPIGFVYPEKGIPIIDSPIGIIKNTKNEKAAKLLYDYILSDEGQKNLMQEFITPVRKGLQPKDAIPIDEAVKRNLPVDEFKLKTEKTNMLKQFDSIFKVKK